MIGTGQGGETHNSFRAVDPVSGEKLDPAFFSASQAEVDEAVRLSNQAFSIYSRTSGREKGKFLRAIAANIEAIAPEVIERAARETALPKARLEGETARTCGQLRLFAQVVEEGSWVMARIDRADPA